MTLRLVKTTGGHSGSPNKCSCGSINFLKTAIAWHCMACGIYFPTDISSSNSFESLRKNMNELNRLHGKLKFMITEIEHLVKE